MMKGNENRTSGENSSSDSAGGLLRVFCAKPFNSAATSFTEPFEVAGAGAGAGLEEKKRENIDVTLAVTPTG